MWKCYFDWSQVTQVASAQVKGAQNIVSGANLPEMAITT